MSLEFIAFFHVFFRVVLHGGPVLSFPQGFPREGSLALMLAADALMDFDQDALCPILVDILDKWNGKSSSINITFDQDIRASSPPDNDRFFWVVGEFSLSEIVMYRGHPTITIPDGEHF